MASKNQRLSGIQPRRSTPSFPISFVFFIARSLSQLALALAVATADFNFLNFSWPTNGHPRFYIMGSLFYIFFIIFISLIKPLSSQKRLLNFWQNKSILSFSFFLFRLMENSMNSYMQHNLVASKATSDSPDEESGWTTYFEDFSSNNSREQSHCSSFDSPSLVSDAASCAAWKLSQKHHAPACSSIGGSPNIPKKLKFKKTRTKQIYDDDSLEDTASSPVNSPKVSDLQPIDMNPRKTDDHMYSSLGKGVASELQPKERSMNFNIGKNDCTDLKGRGLCLVPLSMLVNYLG